MPERELAVVCACTPDVWNHRARRALDSVTRHSPDVEVRLGRYRDPATRFDIILRARARWILFLDADTLCTGDVRPLVRLARADGASILVRRSSLHDHPAWHEDRYRAMLADAGVPYRSVVWNGAFLARRAAAVDFVPRIPRWRRWYLDKWPNVFGRPHKKPDQHALALALAEAGVLDADTLWADGRTFSWHSRPGELGLVHHFNGQIYAQLETAGVLDASIEERRVHVGAS